MARSTHPRLTALARIATILAGLLVAAGAAVEIGVRAKTAAARGHLPRAAAPYERARQEAEASPDAKTLEAARLAATGAGDFDGAARYAALAARLAPGDPRAAAVASDALDAALLARTRPFAWGAIALGGTSLLALLGAHGRRRARLRRRAAYVEHLEGRLLASGDGDGIRVDLLLQPRRGHAPLRAPSPGPTLALVLSNPEVSHTIRLSARHDVRDDAVRVRLGAEALREIRAHPGPWRIQARLDGRLVAEERLRLDAGAERLEPLARPALADAPA